MPNIYIIAGPPGVGKSTLGESFIPPDMDILNEDEMRFKYKAQGYADYNAYSIHRICDTVRWNLIKDNDFALELNLGFKHQFEYANRHDELNPVAEYDKEATSFGILDDSPLWFKDNLMLFIKNYIHGKNKLS